MENEKATRRYAVVSGKGGVGKTVITANVAAAMASAGKRTLVVDADLGLANLDVILGLNPKYTLHDFLSGSKRIDEVIVETPGGFDLLPAGSGVHEGTVLSPSVTNALNLLLDFLGDRYDIMLFDAGAGIGEVVRFFASSADSVLLAVTPEPTSMMDAYATLKVLAQQHGCRKFHLVVNQADPSSPARTGTMVANHLQHVATRFLNIDLRDPISIQLIGSIPSDPSVSQAISRQKLLVENDPQAPASCIIVNLAKTLRQTSSGYGGAIDASGLIRA